MVGGANYARSTFNRATRARRQPGSAFKPIVYAAALSHGYSPVSVLSNLDRVVAPGDPEWQPRNVAHADGIDPTALTLRAALTQSNNAAAAMLQQQITSREVLHLASEVGLTDLPDVPSLALGTGLVSPLALTVAYTMFPGGGEIARPRGMLDVLDANGNQVFDQPVERSRAISDPVAFQMVTMLRDVVDRGTGTAARTLGVVGPIGGKTGTTDDYHDAWFVGFSTSAVVGVWVGFDQPAPIGPEAYGARVALPIWADFMQRVSRALPAGEFAIPEGVHGEPLCSVSHLKPVDGCPVYTEYFKDGDAVPSEQCRVHSGSLKQATTRVIQGLLRGLGSKIAGIFRRR
jgi:penicillin-binding protein 1A